MPAGAKPGERRGGRAKGARNKRTIGMAAAENKAMEMAAQDVVQERRIVTTPEFDSLDLKRKICFILFSLASEEQNKRVSGQKWNPKWLKNASDAADRALNGLLPYEHRRLATLEPAMETVVKPDGSVHVTISRTDSE